MSRTSQAKTQSASQAGYQLPPKEGHIDICLIGIPRVGKTQLRTVLCGKPPIDKDDYTQTEKETNETTHLEINGTEYQIRFWDCSGEEFKNARATCAQFLGRGAIHCLVVSVTDSESSEYLEGIVKGIGLKEEFLPKFKFFVVTHMDEEDDDGVVDKTREIAKSNNMDCFEGNLLEDGETLRASLADYLKKCIAQNPDIAKGCEWKGESAKAEAGEKKDAKKDKKEKKEKKEKGEKKGGCVLL